MRQTPYIFTQLTNYLLKDTFDRLVNKSNGMNFAVHPIFGVIIGLTCRILNSCLRINVFPLPVGSCVKMQMKHIVGTHGSCVRMDNG